MEKINNNGKEKSEHILFYNFYFQKKYKRNATKAIRNTQIVCLTVMIVYPLIDRYLDRVSECSMTHSNC